MPGAAAYLRSEASTETKWSGVMSGKAVERKENVDRHGSMLEPSADKTIILRFELLQNSQVIFVGTIDEIDDFRSEHGLLSDEFIIRVFRGENEELEAEINRKKKVAGDSISPEKDSSVVVLSDEILSAINNLGALLPETGRKKAVEEFKRTAAGAFAPKKKFVSRKDITDDDLNNPVVLQAHISFANQHSKTDPATLNSEDAYKLRKARLVRKYDIDRRHMSNG